MKESYTKGLASHGNPESCTGTREGTGEALTGAHTGGVLSRENRLNQGDIFTTRCCLSRKATCECASRQAHLRPCAVEDPQHVLEEAECARTGESTTPACGRWSRRPRWEGRRPQSRAILTE